MVWYHGFAATSLDQVLKDAGTSKGAFFHHFESKTALGRALTERYVEGDIGQLRAALDVTAPIDDPVERVLVLEAAARSRDIGLDDVQALADHVCVTFEGAFLLCRSTGEPDHMRAQLRVLRSLLASALGAPSPVPA